MNRFTYTLSLLAILFIFNSCQTTQPYGSRHDRYSSDRIANFDDAKHGKRARSTSRSRSYTRSSPKKSETNRTNTVVASHSTTQSSKFKKVNYHSERNSILREAQKYKGIPYLYGGKNPESGFDCSGFVSYVFNSNKIYINGSASSLSRLGRKKNPNELNAGDLVFFGEKGKVTHVGIVSMNDGTNLTMIHSSTSAGIRSDNVYHSDYWNKRLMFGVDIVSSHFEEDLGMK